jgi:hypothetical protein
MTFFKNFIFLCLIGSFLTACGDQGVFGNNKGPKKPDWANQSSEKLFN